MTYRRQTLALFWETFGTTRGSAFGGSGAAATSADDTNVSDERPQWAVTCVERLLRLQLVKGPTGYTLLQRKNRQDTQVLRLKTDTEAD